MFGWIGLIWFLSSLPGDSLPKMDAFSFDKLAHTTVYLILSVLVFLNFNGGLFKNMTRHEVLALAVMIAALEEAHQLFITNRFVSALDLSANMFGIFLGYFLIKSFDKSHD
jgi:VanZ family protein